MDNQDKDKFVYTYSAKEQQEIKNIRKKYATAAPEEDKMAYLHKLDAGVYQKGSIVSIIVGVIGALMLGIGMCCAMIWQGFLFIPGIIIGIVGIGILSFAYPLYQKVIQKEREKIAPEIIRLTDELMK